MRPARLALALAALAACARSDREAAEAVREYDEALVLAYRTGDVSRLSRVAAPGEVARVQVLVDLKAGSGLVLESTLESLETIRVETSRPGAATVETRERWRYFDRHLRPGEPPGPTIVAEMAMRYDLVREDGRWKVREVRTLASRPR